ncbi:uncharacterized protein LOC113355307 isoform X2 [Papaver somniferum]|uniref:uncharacterized protein LOC113355307 isoform X2 n=1 Tax=Papaver somniferum TaxID=3469 RepID=UPI000E6FD040|nr:uncharacterized protein LOC113355307 isoform X2 [Papaver somniferum]
MERWRECEQSINFKFIGSRYNWNLIFRRLSWYPNTILPIRFKAFVVTSLECLNSFYQISAEELHRAKSWSPTCICQSGFHRVTVSLKLDSYPGWSLKTLLGKKIVCDDSGFFFLFQVSY